MGTPKLVAVIEFLEWTGIGQTQALGDSVEADQHSVLIAITVPGSI